jgi:cobalt-zinc-cadmium efflux system outer membrane protein
MRIVVFCATLLAVVVPSRAAAQALTLTESEALTRLSPDSPRVRAIRAPIELARADVLAAGRWPNPRLTFDRESVAGITENMLMVTQLLPITGRRRLDVQAAEAMVAASSSRVDDEFRRLRADLRLAFAELLAAQARERELTASRDRLRGLAEVLAKREAAGDAAGFDRLRVEREGLDSDADRAVAAIDRARAQGTLAGFFADVPDPSGLEATSSSTAVSIAIPSVEELIAHAEATRGDLMALRHEIEATRFAERAAGRRLVPEPEFVAGSKSSTAAGGDIGSVVSVHATIPLFDRARPERALAVARAAQAEARLDALRQVLRVQIAALRATVVERRAVADRYRSEAVHSAEQIERIAQVSYDAGERGILELLDAHRIGAIARVRQSTLDAAARQAEIELEFVSGWETP